MFNHQNVFYTGPVGVGNANRNFECIFDTGSSLIFINSVYCPDIGCQKGE